MKHYAEEATGTYLGAFDIAPEQAVEVPIPTFVTDIWDGAEWHRSTKLRGYSQELAELNAAYQGDLDAINKAFITASIVQGASMTAKQAAIREQFNIRKARYVADLNELRTKFGA